MFNLSRLLESFRRWRPYTYSRIIRFRSLLFHSIYLLKTRDVSMNLQRCKVELVFIDDCVEYWKWPCEFPMFPVERFNGGFLYMIMKKYFCSWGGGKSGPHQWGAQGVLGVNPFHLPPPYPIFESEMRLIYDLSYLRSNKTLITFIYLFYHNNM